MRVHSAVCALISRRSTRRAGPRANSWQCRQFWAVQAVWAVRATAAATAEGDRQDRRKSESSKATVLRDVTPRSDKFGGGSGLGRIGRMAAWFTCV